MVEVVVCVVFVVEGVLLVAVVAFVVVDVLGGGMFVVVDVEGGSCVVVVVDVWLCVMVPIETGAGVKEPSRPHPDVFSTTSTVNF